MRCRDVKYFETTHGVLKLPAFLPDATRGVVRALDADGLHGCGISGLMVNTLHLSSHPGTTVVEQLGGIHSFMGWDGPVMSDSGGFQVFSLIAENAKAGRVSKDGFAYRLDRKKKKQNLTPEKCIQKQFHIGADVMFCLDHCTHPDENATAQRESVAHTVNWASRCKEEFERRANSGYSAKLFAVVQGGTDEGLRRECAERLLEIGFDGYGYGGWPIADDGGLVEAVAQVAELVPVDTPKHALGIGKPENVVRAFELGYHTFDCTIPTRDARNRRLYVSRDDTDYLSDDFYRYVYIGDERYARDNGPIDATCDGLCCQRYSRAYIHHLFAIGETLALRLATIHNLRFYGRLMERLAANHAKS